MWHQIDGLRQQTPALGAERQKARTIRTSPMNDLPEDEK
jgi:hypothetical protein